MRDNIERFLIIWLFIVVCKIFGWITISWFWIFSPFWLSLMFVLLIIVMYLIAVIFIGFTLLLKYFKK